MTKERPILFSGPMVRAILEGRKTQTRRIVQDRYFGIPPSWTELITREHDESSVYVGWGWMPEQPRNCRRESWRGICPYGQPGNRIWVKETFRIFGGDEYAYQHRVEDIRYRATAAALDYVSGPWRPSIFMPRWASRITLEVTAVRVERLQDISEDDAQAEGVLNGSGSHDFDCDGKQFHPDAQCDCGGNSLQQVYARLWESINGAGSWAANPWVWVIEFRKLSA